MKHVLVPEPELFSEAEDFGIKFTRNKFRMLISGFREKKENFRQKST